MRFDLAREGEEGGPAAGCFTYMSVCQKRDGCFVFKQRENGDLIQIQVHSLDLDQKSVLSYSTSQLFHAIAPELKQRPLLASCFNKTTADNVRND